MLILSLWLKLILILSLLKVNPFKPRWPTNLTSKSLTLIAKTAPWLCGTCYQPYRKSWHGKPCPNKTLKGGVAIISQPVQWKMKSGAYNQMNINFVTSPANGAKINSKTVSSWIYELISFFCYSAQHLGSFSIDFDFCQSKLHQKGIKFLEIDFVTQWNSTFTILQ